MQGWTLVAPEGLTEDEQLKMYVEMSLDFVETLPTKK